MINKITRFFAAIVIAAGVYYHVDAATWIWYPGDYGIWMGNELQSRRLQWGSHLPTMWPNYEPHSRVIFSKELKLVEDEVIEVRWDGNLTLEVQDKYGYHQRSPILGKFKLDKSTSVLKAKVQNSARVPSVWIKGKTVETDGSWKCGWYDEENIWAETSLRFSDPDKSPCLTKLATREKKPVWVKPFKDNHLIADFGEETYGYLRLKNITGSGVVRIIFAESESEMYTEDLDASLDGWEIIEVSEADEFRHKFPRGFRYIHVIPFDGDVKVGSLTMDYEWKDIPLKGSFKCNNELLNKIYDVSVHTLELTCREVFIEGIKRDHWIWSGDAVQSFLMNYYTFGDYDGVRDTLWAVRGKDPVVKHLNHIMDYTFYWFDAVELYRLYSGDDKFVHQVYPRMKSLMEWAISRLDANGRPHDAAGDWMFIDWASVSLNNYGGITAFEQILLVRALEAIAEMAKVVGNVADVKAYSSRAKKLRDEVKPLFWSEEKGALMHILKDDGKLDVQLTRYPNMFGLFYGYFNESERERVINGVMLNDKVLKIQTPYMRFYELASLCSFGMQKEVLSEILEYWGGMLDNGATSFWELYNPDEKGEAKYSMYQRPFGKSLCHAWGASPVYLLGRYFIGVEPTSPGFKTYSVRPVLGGLEWFEGVVPTPMGAVKVKLDALGCEVTGAPDGIGTVYYNGEEKTLRPNEKIFIKNLQHSKIRSAK